MDHCCTPRGTNPHQSSSRRSSYGNVLSKTRGGVIYSNQQQKVDLEPEVWPSCFDADGHWGWMTLAPERTSSGTASPPPISGSSNKQTAVLEGICDEFTQNRDINLPSEETKRNESREDPVLALPDPSSFLKIFSLTIDDNSQTKEVEGSEAPEMDPWTRALSRISDEAHTLSTALVSATGEFDRSVSSGKAEQSAQREPPQTRPVSAPSVPVSIPPRTVEPNSKTPNRSSWQGGSQAFRNSMKKLVTKVKSFSGMSPEQHKSFFRTSSDDSNSPKSPPSSDSKRAVNRYHWQKAAHTASAYAQMRNRGKP